MGPHNFLLTRHCRLGWKLVDLQFLSHSLNTEFEHKGMNMVYAKAARKELARSCVQICVQSKRKSSYELFRNCLTFRRWSHLYYAIAVKWVIFRMMVFKITEMDTSRTPEDFIIFQCLFFATPRPPPQGSSPTEPLARPYCKCEAFASELEAHVGVAGARWRSHQDSPQS